MDHAFAREHSAAIVHERATERAFVEPHRDLVGKTREHAACDRAGLGFAFLEIEALGARDGKKLLPELSCLPGRTRVHPEARATLRIEVVLFRKPKRAEQNEEIGFILAAERIFALVAHLFALGAAEQIAALGREPR